MRAVLAACIFFGICAVACAQYPGHVKKDADTTPSLRATGVFEWTGDLTKPTAGRLIPIAVWDGSAYQPGGLYMAQPAPLTVLTGTVYQLEQAGTPKGLFTVNTAANLGSSNLGSSNLSGFWIGIGSVKPEMVVAKAKPPMSKHPPQVVKDVDSDRPTLHRKDSASDSSSSSTTGSSSASGGKSTTAASSGSANSGTTDSSDPDRPTLHRRDTSDTSSSSSSSDSGNSGNDGTVQNSSSNDPDRPTLHRKDDSGSSAQSAPSVDPDRPTLHKRADTSPSGSAAGAPVTATADTDPDRPRLRHGKPERDEGTVEPSKLEGVPADMNQITAISDTKEGEPHSYVYSWADPDDANKMKSEMEELAQKIVVGNAATPSPAQKTGAASVTKTTATRHKAAVQLSLPPLTEEKFNAFELAYNSGATIVFSAKTTGEGDAVKYVTLIAKPDFYGVPQVIFKQVTNEDRLDITPRMRLVDAADTDADNRAELIFELRGKTGRQFAIYRLMNGHLQEAFNTGPLP